MSGKRTSVYLDDGLAAAVAASGRSMGELVRTGLDRPPAPDGEFARLRELVAGYEPSRERSLVQTKLDEAEMWLARCRLA